MEANKKRGHKTLKIIGIILLILILIGMAFKKRFFCQFLCPMGAVFSILSGAGLPPPSVTTLIASVSAKFLIAYAKDIAESYKNGTLAKRYPKIYNIVSRFINPNNTQLAFA